MIVWLNGPFGAGKTMLAKRLCERLPRSLHFGPEVFGHLVRTMVPAVTSGDYQDLPVWRAIGTPGGGSRRGC